MRVTPMVKVLLASNAVIYFLDLIFLDVLIGNFAEFSIKSAIFQLRLWEFITFQFIHGSVGHLLFNCMGLYFFGPWMERWWGSKSFLLFYLLCGVAGAAFYVLLAYAGILRHVSPDTELVGASAGIYGILIGVAMVAPSMRVSLLLPPVTLTMRQLALYVMTFAVVMIVFDIFNAGGEAGHLGGAIMGAALVWLWREGGIFGARNQDPNAVAIRPRKIVPKIRPQTVIDLNASTEVDAILEKISRDGFQSLTEEEKETLQAAAKRDQD